MGDFSESPNWTLVNDFTIHEDKSLRDRPFMRTCVPQPIDVDVISFEIVRRITWPDTLDADGESRPNIYADGSYLRFNGEFDDTVIIFDMSDGEIATFKALTDATIRPLPAGSMGGKNRATTFDGIGFSGMSSRRVPDDGLMAGEPGNLFFSPENESKSDRTKSEMHLTAELYLDEDRFFSLLQILSVGPPDPGTFRLCVLAELFESEISASLSESWMSRDYGLLQKTGTFARTKARIESISVSKGMARSGRQVEAVEDTDSTANEGEGTSTTVASDYSARALMYQRYILLALVVLIAATLLGHW